MPALHWFINAIVVADDADVFVLLCHFRNLGMITEQVQMISSIKGRSVMNIYASATNNDSIMEGLPMHGFSGCDTVASYFGIRKGIALRVLRTLNNSLNLLGDITVELKDVVKQCTRSVLSCCGKEDTLSSNDATRYKLWMRKLGNNIVSAPKLHSLPPRDKDLCKNVSWTHIQAAVCCWLFGTKPTST